MGQNKYTISDISELTGVSRAGVSRAINGLPGVNPASRQAVLEAVEKLNYKHKAPPAEHKPGSVNIIALIVEDIRNPFCAELGALLQAHFERNGYISLIFSTEYSEKRENEYLEMAQSFSFAGVVIIAMQNKSLQDQLTHLNMPTVLVNRTLDNYNGDAVVFDNFQAAYMITKYMIEQGYPEIAMITGPMELSTSHQRFLGYRQALLNYSVPCSEKYIFEGNFKLTSGLQIGLDYLDHLNEYPKAVLAGTDMMSIGFLEACKRRGVRVPDQISIGGIDNIEISSLTDIELTTVEQNAEEMAGRAADLMLRKLKDRSAPAQKIIIEPKLIVRKTIARYRESG